MQYFLLILAVTSLILAYINNVKYRKLKSGGKIPNIMSARRKVTLYLLLSVTSFIAYIFMLVEMA